MCGSLGENQPLTPEEKRKVIQLTKQVVNGRIPVLSGVADCETLEADGFMVMPAMVYKADGGEAMNHFRRVAAATSNPWMLNNNPVGDTIDITPSQFAPLAGRPNLIAIQESSADTSRISELRIEVGNRYSLFVDVDDLLLELGSLKNEGWWRGR